MRRKLQVLSVLLVIFAAAVLLGREPEPVTGVSATLASQHVTPRHHGDDPYLDALWEQCLGDGGAACADLYWEAPADSAYESFAMSCGGHGASDRACADGIAEDYAHQYGDDPVLDALMETCAGSAGDTCRQLRSAAPRGSDYAQFAMECLQVQSCPPLRDGSS